MKIDLVSSTVEMNLMDLFVQPKNAMRSLYYEFETAKVIIVM